MRFIPGSLGMAVLWSTLATLGLSYARKKRLITGKAGLASAGVICGLCVLRLLAPIDFEASIGIPAYGFYSTVYFFFWEVRKIGPWSISLWQIFLIIWAAGAVLKTLCFLCGYFQDMRRIDCLPDYCPEQTERICRLIGSRTGREADCRVLCSPAVHMPAGIGLFRRKILMPDIICGNEELYYILLHELTHFRNGDLFLKFGLQVIGCLFWWNPCIRLLQRELSQDLEIRCDLTVAKGLTGEEICEYMSVILAQVRRSSRLRMPFHTLPLVAASVAEENSALALKERFGAITGEYGRKKKKQPAFLAAAAALLLFFGSYTFLPLQGDDPTIEDLVEGEGISLESENPYLYTQDGDWYLVINEDLIYDISKSEADSYIKAGFLLKEDYEK